MIYKAINVQQTTAESSMRTFIFTKFHAFNRRIFCNFHFHFDRLFGRAIVSLQTPNNFSLCTWRWCSTLNFRDFEKLNRTSQKHKIVCWILTDTFPVVRAWRTPAMSSRTLAIIHKILLNVIVPNWTLNFFLVSLGRVTWDFFFFC